MEGLDELFRLEVLAAKLAWREELSAIIRSAEEQRINAGPRRVPLSEYMERFIEGGLEGNRYAWDGYRDEAWLLNICRKLVSGDMEEMGEEGCGTDKWMELLRYAKEYIGEHPLKEYGMETCARVYSVAVHDEFMKYAPEDYCRELWAAEAARVEEEGCIEELGEYSGVEYLRMYLAGVTGCLTENMEYVDEDTHKQVSDILREQGWMRGKLSGV